MRNLINRAGTRYGRLIAVSMADGRGSAGEALWQCVCDCGSSCVVIGSSLGRTLSCGCLAREMSAARGRARKRSPVPCSVVGCSFTTEKGGHGLCGKHAIRLRRYGDVHYLTPESSRRETSRRAQLARIVKRKPTTYPKLLGRHEHRVVAEKMLGRPLRRGEVVHHKDRNPQNNDPANLAVMTQSDHAALHAAEGW